ncbi:MAG: hypothetical protein C0174_01810 [Thermodesulfobium narugense]|nr:MAG: hypothetical protein C0174_01810 [Thermodesulfobium narugense]
MFSESRQILAFNFYKKYFKIDIPFKHQIELWEKIRALEFPILLKAPAGSGKTEAVLAPFLSQFVENKFYIAPRLIYFLPMRVLVNNIARRMKCSPKTGKGNEVQNSLS